MRDFITHVGGYLVIGLALYVVDRVAYRRGQRAERAAQDAERERRLARIMRSVRCAPSGVSLTLHGYTDERAAVFLIMDSGCAWTRVVED